MQIELYIIERQVDTKIDFNIESQIGVMCIERQQCRQKDSNVDRKTAMQIERQQCRQKDSIVDRKTAMQIERQQCRQKDSNVQGVHCDMLQSKCIFWAEKLFSQA